MRIRDAVQNGPEAKEKSKLAKKVPRFRTSFKPKERERERIFK